MSYRSSELILLAYFVQIIVKINIAGQQSGGGLGQASEGQREDEEELCVPRKRAQVRLLNFGQGGPWLSYGCVLNSFFFLPSDPILMVVL